MLPVLALAWATIAHAQTDTVTYMHTDGVGSVRMLTNESRQVIARYDYLPFGEPCTTACGTSASPTSSKQFAGREKDTESGLDYFGARYYRNIGGRFITADPDHVGGNLFDPQSWNAYAYARNNPLRFVDPTGTDYFVNIDGGGSFSFNGSFGQFGAFASGFDVGSNWLGGIIYNGAGQRVGTFRYYDPRGFDALVYQAGRISKPGGDFAVAGLQLIMAPVAPIPIALAACASAMRSGEGCSGAGLAMAAIPVLPKGMGLQTFANLIGWTKGGTLAKNLILTSVTIEGLAARLPLLRAAGVTPQIAREWAQFYRGVAAANSQNPNALPRAQLMEALAELLSK